MNFSSQEDRQKSKTERQHLSIPQGSIDNIESHRLADAKTSPRYNMIISHNNHERYGSSRRIFNVRRRTLLFLCMLLSVVLGMSIMTAKNREDTVISNQADTSELHSSRFVAEKTPLEERLTSEQIAILRSIKPLLYIPQNQGDDNYLLVYSQKSPQKLLLSYVINPKFGMGLVKGTYGVNVYPKTGIFNPPKDCGSPSGVKTPSPLACVLYERAEKDIPAYTYNWHAPGSIQHVGSDGHLSQPITMFAVLPNNMIVSIGTSDTDPSELYSFIKTLAPVTARQLPASTIISSFDDQGD